MYRIWPLPSTASLTDDDLRALYAPDAGIPSLRVNFVSSIDGAVEVNGYSAGLGTPADKRVFALLRTFPHALMVGAGTLRHEGYGALVLDDERRAWRQRHGLDPYPRLVIVSSRLGLEPNYPALAQAPVRPIVVTSANAPRAQREALAEVADVIAYGDDEVDLPAALAELRRRGLGHILCEGGPHLFGSLTAVDAVDELCLTISPLLAGAGAGRITAPPPHSGTNVSAEPFTAPREMKLRHVLMADDTLLLRYVRAPNARSAAQNRQP